MTSTYTITMHAKGGLDKYPAKAHARRVASKLDAHVSLLAIRGEKVATFMHSDLTRPFRQDRYFYYLSGSNDPDSWLTYHTHTDTLTLWLPPVDLSRVFYDGRTTTVEEALQKYDIDEAKYIRGEKARCNLSQYIKRAALLGRCAVLQIPRFLLGPKVMETLTEDVFELGLTDALDACRAVKDEHEIALVRRANEVSGKAHVAILRSLHRLQSEAQVEAVYIAACLAEKAKEQSYPPICGAGINASQLHYSTNLDDFGNRQTLLVDAGAEWQCYASDVTRTMPINPARPGHWQTEEAQTIYRIVERIQEECISMLGPGVAFWDAEMKAHNMSVDALLELGVLKGKREEILAAGTWQAFGHGLGHHVGLEVHDVPPPSAKKAGESKSSSSEHTSSPENQTMENKEQPTVRRNRVRRAFKTNANDPPLEPGMIVTVEPGMYFNQFVLEQVFLPNPQHSKFINAGVARKYYHVGGVRIEDDILITADGYENLTTAPKGDAALNIIREAAKAASEEGKQ